MIVVVFFLFCFIDLLMLFGLVFFFFKCVQSISLKYLINFFFYLKYWFIYSVLDFEIGLFFLNLEFFVVVFFMFVNNMCMSQYINLFNIVYRGNVELRCIGMYY